MIIKEFKEILLKKALESGFTHGEAYYEGGKSFEVVIHNSEISHFENSILRGLSFRGTYKGKMGYSYSEDISENSIEFLINEAKSNAEIIEDGENEELFAGEESYKSIDLFNEKNKNISVEKRISDAKKMEISAKNTSDKIESVDYCLNAYGENEISILNTKGLDVNYSLNLGSAYTSVIAKENEDVKTSSEYWIGYDYSNFNPAQIGKEAAKKALSHLGAKSVKSGKYKILLKNQVASSILGTFSGIFFGENIQKGFSLLSGKVGSKIASQKITLRDNGILEGGFGTVPFDSEGVASINKSVIENGVLKTFLYNLKSASKDNVKSTGNGFKPSFKSTVQTACTNFYIEKGEKTFDELVKTIDNGLLITEIAGLHSGTNTVSGDFSLSAEGFLIEDGNIKTPVEQITIAGNFYEVLKNIEEVGDDLRFNMPSGNGTIGCPTVYIKKLDVSGN